MIPLWQEFNLAIQLNPCRGTCVRDSGQRSYNAVTTSDSAATTHSRQLSYNIWLVTVAPTYVVAALVSPVDCTALVSCVYSTDYAFCRDVSDPKNTYPSQQTHVLAQCCFNANPASMTLGQHWNNIWWTSVVPWGGAVNETLEFKAGSLWKTSHGMRHDDGGQQTS